MATDHHHTTHHQPEQPTPAAHDHKTPVAKPTVRWPAYFYLSTSALILILAAKGVGSLMGDILLAAVCGAYGWYLFRGGRFVIINAWVMLAPLLLIPVLFMPRNSSSSRSASDLKSMKCKEYMALDRNDRAEAADKLFKADNGYTNSLGSTNTMLSIESYCNDYPSRQIGNAL